MTAEQLSSVAGIVLSLAFSYLPGVKERFTDLTPTQKQAVIGITLIAITVAVFAGACLGLIESVTCTRRDAMGLLSSLVSALVANQSTYLLTKNRNGKA